jgi:hypothetical protein
LRWPHGRPCVGGAGSGGMIYGRFAVRLRSRSKYHGRHSQTLTNRPTKQMKPSLQLTYPMCVQLPKSARLSFFEGRRYHCRSRPACPSKEALSSSSSATHPNTRRAVRSTGVANGACVRLRPQLSKHAPRIRQATHISWPASLFGGLLSRKRRRTPPGRMMMLLKSASGVGFLSTLVA